MMEAPDLTIKSYEHSKTLPYLDKPRDAALIDLGTSLCEVPGDECVDWLREVGSWMKDGARLLVKVPDFDFVVRAYEAGTCDPEPLVMRKGAGRSLWNREKLSTILNHAGFEILGGTHESGRWTGDDGMLSVVAMKCMRPHPQRPMKDVHCVMSMPRLCWTDNTTSVSDMGAALGMDVMRTQGVFWGQCYSRVFEDIIAKPQYRYILTIDYDTVFSPEDVVRLWQVMESHPTIDAICPLQIMRDKDALLLSIRNDDGSMMQTATAEFFHRDVIDMHTGHFGLTLIRTESLRRLPRPWFLAIPNDQGRWDEGRTDEDIYFWKNMIASGMRICVCPKVRVGHIQNVITWPGEDMRTIHQYLSKYNSEGRPAQCRSF